MRTAVRVVVVLSMLATSFMVVPAGRATYPGGNGQIAFGGFANTGAIATMNPDGSMAGLLIDTKRDEFAPSYQGDGSRFAYASGGGGSVRVGIASSEGNDATLITPPGSFGVAPTLSPDGSKIAFAQFDGEFFSGELWMMNPDGSGATKLTEGVNVDPSGLSFRPDGGAIVFPSFDEGFSSFLSLYEIGSGMVSNIAGPMEEQFISPEFSPDGSKIAYVEGFDPAELVVIDSDGSGRTVVPTPFGSVASFDWAPDGTGFVVSGWNGSTGGVATMTTDGANAQMIHGQAVFELAWQPCPGDCTISGMRAFDMGNFNQYRKGKKKFQVETFLFPAIPGLDIKITLKRKKPGSNRFKKVGTKTTATDANGVAKSLFRVGKKGRCKSISKFMGDATYEPVTRKATGPCKRSFGFRPGGRP